MDRLNTTLLKPPITLACNRPLTHNAASACAGLEPFDISRALADLGSTTSTELHLCRARPPATRLLDISAELSLLSTAAAAALATSTDSATDSATDPRRGTAALAGCARQQRRSLTPDNSRHFRGGALAGAFAGGSPPKPQRSATPQHQQQQQVRRSRASSVGGPPAPLAQHTYHRSLLKRRANTVAALSGDTAPAVHTKVARGDNGHGATVRLARSARSGSCSPVPQPASYSRSQQQQRGEGARRVRMRSYDAAVHSSVQNPASHAPSQQQRGERDEKSTRSSYDGATVHTGAGAPRQRPPQWRRSASCELHLTREDLRESATHSAALHADRSRDRAGCCSAAHAGLGERQAPNTLRTESSNLRSTAPQRESSAYAPQHPQGTAAECSAPRSTASRQVRPASATVSVHSVHSSWSVHSSQQAWARGPGGCASFSACSVPAHSDARVPPRCCDSSCHENSEASAQTSPVSWGPDAAGCFDALHCHSPSRCASDLDLTADAFCNGHGCGRGDDGSSGEIADIVPVSLPVPRPAPAAEKVVPVVQPSPDRSALRAAFLGVLENTPRVVAAASTAPAHSTLFLSSAAPPLSSLEIKRSSCFDASSRAVSATMLVEQQYLGCERAAASPKSRGASSACRACEEPVTIAECSGAAAGAVRSSVERRLFREALQQAGALVRRVQCAEGTPEERHAAGVDSL